MTGRVRRRIGVAPRGLTLDEELFLLHGTGPGFHYPDLDGTWTLDEPAARAAWAAYRQELWERTASGLIPWAAVAFDGRQGRTSRYAHLRGHESLEGIA
jgi:hypothetical protein